MPVRVQIPTPMRTHTGGQATVEVEGTTVQAILDGLGTKCPGIGQRILENGQVKRFVNVYLNDEDIRYLDNLNTPVKYVLIRGNDADSVQLSRYGRIVR